MPPATCRRFRPEGIGGQITGETWTATNIYLAPTTLGAITFNFLMSLSGGLMVAYVVSKGDRVLDLLRRPGRVSSRIGRQ